MVYDYFGMLNDTIGVVIFIVFPVFGALVGYYLPIWAQILSQVIVFLLLILIFLDGEMTELGILIGINAMACVMLFSFATLATRHYRVHIR